MSDPALEAALRRYGRELRALQARAGASSRMDDLLAVFGCFGEWLAPFAHHGLDPEDLVQEAWLAVMEAAARHDPARGSLAAYARAWVRRALNDQVNAGQGVVRIAATAGERKVLNNLRGLARDPRRVGRAEAVRIAASLGVRVEEVERVSRALALERAELDDEGSSPGGEALQDVRTPEWACLAMDEARWRRAFLRRSLAALAERERYVVMRRWLARHPRPREKLGSRLGVSGERVRQIERRALGMMRALAA